MLDDGTYICEYINPYPYIYLKIKNYGPAFKLVFSVNVHVLFQLLNYKIKRKTPFLKFFLKQSTTAKHNLAFEK